MPSLLTLLLSLKAVPSDRKWQNCHLKLLNMNYRNYNSGYIKVQDKRQRLKSFFFKFFRSCIKQKWLAKKIKHLTIHALYNVILITVICSIFPIPKCKSWISCLSPYPYIKWTFEDESKYRFEFTLYDSFMHYEMKLNFLIVLHFSTIVQDTWKKDRKVNHAILIL